MRLKIKIAAWLFYLIALSMLLPLFVGRHYLLAAGMVFCLCLFTLLLREYKKYRYTFYSGLGRVDNFSKEDYYARERWKKRCRLFFRIFKPD